MSDTWGRVVVSQQAEAPAPTNDPNEAIKNSLNAQIKNEGNELYIKVTKVEPQQATGVKITYTVNTKEIIYPDIIKNKQQMLTFISKLQEIWAAAKQLAIMQRNVLVVWTQPTPNYWAQITWLTNINTTNIDLSDPNNITTLQTQYDAAVTAAMPELNQETEEQQWARFWEFITDWHWDMFDINDDLEKIYYRAYDQTNNGIFTWATIAMSWDNLHGDAQGKANKFDAKIPVWKVLPNNKKKLVWIVLVWEALKSPTGLNELYANVIDENNPEDSPNWPFGWIIATTLTGKLTEAWLVQIKSDGKMYIVEVWDPQAHETIRIEGDTVDKWSSADNPVYITPEGGKYSFKWNTTLNGNTTNDSISFEITWLHNIVKKLYNPETS